MTELIELRFKYTEDEFAEAWQFYATRSYLKKVDVLVALLLILVSLIMIAINGYEWLWGLLFVIGFIFLVLNFIGYFVTPRQRFRRDAKYQEEYYLGISDTGLHFKMSNAESQLEWSFYQKVWNVPRHYLLFYGRDLFTLIPKRVFGGKEQEEQFKELVQRKLSPTVIQIFS